ncbi:hypothetical protein ASG14_16380 [Pedobacter sp. Leaf194]|nr:hypothetical protein ASG14_16380 [Pedobacter sp. Leaf194]
MGIGEEEGKLLKVLAGIYADMILEDYDDQLILETHPEGYHPEKRKPGQLCGIKGSGKALWFDEHGYKCMSCERALNENLYPKEIFYDKTQFYTDAYLSHYFNLKGKTLENWIAAGLLRSISIPGEKPDQIHFRIYLLIEHQGFLRLKALFEIMQVQTHEENGQESHSTS